MSGNNHPAKRPRFTRSRGDRCETCARHHQKCVFSQQDGICDRCRDVALVCTIIPRSQRIPPWPQNTVKDSANSIPKCDHCRVQRQKCVPDDRVWPARCERCIQRRLACGPPHTAREYRELYHDDQSAGRASKRQSAPENVQQEQHTQHSLMPMYNSKSESSNSDSSSDSEAENPAVLPATISPAVVNPPVTNHSAAHTSGPSHTGRSPPIANSAATSHPKRKRLSTHGHFDAPEEVWSLRTRNTELENTIRGMEDEFQGILDEERKMHRAELDDQRKKHEQELKAVRERYEKRQDDLIQTIVKLSSVK